MNLYAVPYTWGLCSEYGGLQIWCARDKEHLESMIIEYEKSEFELFADDPWVRGRLLNGIRDAVEHAKVLSNETPGLLRSFNT